MFKVVLREAEADHIQILPRCAWAKFERSIAALSSNPRPLFLADVKWGVEDFFSMNFCKNLLKNSPPFVSNIGVLTIFD